MKEKLMVTYQLPLFFLDEIWKASPSIQNTLLTIINEKIFKNGTETIDVPLQLLIAASNELPAENEGLEALYDRFIIRFYVDNIVNKKKFHLMLDSDHQQLESIFNEEKLTFQEIHEIKVNASKIKIDENTINFIDLLKEKIDTVMLEAAPYISDRRWKKAVGILKTSAYLSSRDKISFPDLLLFQHLLWENPEQEEALKEIIFDTWKETILKAYKLDLQKELQIINDLENQFNTAYQENEIPYTVNIMTSKGTVEHYVYCYERSSEISYVAFKTKEKFNLTGAISQYNYYVYEDETKSQSVEDVLNHFTNAILFQSVWASSVTLLKDSLKIIGEKYTKLTHHELIKHDDELKGIATQLLDFSLNSMTMLNKRNSIDSELRLIECHFVHDYILNLNHLLQDIDEQIKLIKTKKISLDNKLKKVLNK